MLHALSHKRAVSELDLLDLKSNVFRIPSLCFADVLNFGGWIVNDQVHKGILHLKQVESILNGKLQILQHAIIFQTVARFQFLWQHVKESPLPVPS